MDVVRQLALLAKGYEGHAQFPSRETTEDESACLHACHCTDVLIDKGGQQLIDSELKGPRVAHQWGDIPKYDAGFGKIRDGTDFFSSRCIGHPTALLAPVPNGLATYNTPPLMAKP